MLETPFGGERGGGGGGKAGQLGTSLSWGIYLVKKVFVAVIVAAMVSWFLPGKCCDIPIFRVALD